MMCLGAMFCKIEAHPVEHSGVYTCTFIIPPRTVSPGRTRQTFPNREYFTMATWHHDLSVPSLVTPIRPCMVLKSAIQPGPCETKCNPTTTTSTTSTTTTTNTAKFCIGGAAVSHNIHRSICVFSPFWADHFMVSRRQLRHVDMGEQKNPPEIKKFTNGTRNTAIPKMLRSITFVSG